MDRCRALGLVAALSAAASGMLGCAEKGPRDALDRYRDALRRGDADAIWALCDSSLQSAYDPEALKAYLASDPEAAVRAAERLGAVKGEIIERAEVPLEGGAAVQMARENGSWRIVAGGLEPARFDTPERALSALFAAVKGHRLGVIRRLMPKRYAETLPTNDALSAHLAMMAPRIARAEASLGALTPGLAVIHGTSAEIAYGGTKRVTFELEDGTWRVLDLE